MGVLKHGQQQRMQNVSIFVLRAVVLDVRLTCGMFGSSSPGMAQSFETPVSNDSFPNTAVAGLW